MVRLAMPRDMDTIRKNNAAQNERDGTDYPMAPLFKSDGSFAENIGLALVGEDEHGNIRSCVYFELVAEMQFAGSTPEDTAELRSHISSAAYILRQKGIGSIHCLVPTSLIPKKKRSPIARALEWAGFTRDDHRLCHFAIDIRR